MKKLIIIQLLMLFAFAASAQNNSELFAGASAGFNFGIDGQKYESRVQSHVGSGFAADFYVGGWLGKTIGLRGGYQGFTSSNSYSVFGSIKYNYIHADALFRIASSFVPYVHAGWVIAAGNSIGGGAGLMLPIRLAEHVSIVPDFRASLSSNSIYGIANPGLALTPSATLGIMVNFGKSGARNKD